MKVISNIRYYLLLVILLTASAAVFGQEKQKSKNYEFCSDNWNWSNGDKVSAKDLRETTFAAPGTLNVDAGKNGGISVRGENRSDVFVRACVQAWGANSGRSQFDSQKHPRRNRLDRSRRQFARAVITCRSRIKF